MVLQQCQQLANSFKSPTFESERERKTSKPRLNRTEKKQLYHPGNPQETEESEKKQKCLFTTGNIRNELYILDFSTVLCTAAGGLVGRELTLRSEGKEIASQDS